MALNNSIRNVGAPVTEGFSFTRATDDPDTGTATFVGATYTMRLFNDAADTSSDVTLTNDDGITVTSESANASAIKIVITTTQLTTLYTGATLKSIPNDEGKRKGAIISYTIQMAQIGYAASQGADDTDYTGKFYLTTEALAGR